jgi:hypothetical protein
LLYDLTFNETCPDAFGGLNTTFVLSRSTVAANLQTTVAPQFRTPCDFFDLATQPPTSGFVTDPAGAVTNIPSFIPSLIRSYTTRLSIVGGCAAQAEITVFFETPCASSYSVVLLSPAISFSNQSSCMDGVSFPLSSTAAVFAGGRNVSLAISGTVDVSGNPLP